MKKGLIGIVVLAFVVLICGTALAETFESFDVTGTVEFTLFNETGIMPVAGGDAPSITVPDLTISVGAWEAKAADYIKYTAEIGSITLNNEVSYGIYDLGTDITAAQGITLATEMAPLSLDAVYTTNSEYGFGLGYAVEKGIVTTETTTVEVEVVDEETWAWVDDDENAETPPVWGHPMKTVEEEVEEEVTKEETVVDIGVKYNSTGDYGVQLVGYMAPITLTGQYASGGYLVKGVYALATGTVTMQYKDVAGATEILGELADFQITDTTKLKLSATSATAGTTIVGETATTLAENVTLTMNVTSAAGDLTYFGKIGVSF